MQAGKRCVHCNEVNASGWSYCIRCGKYLTEKANEQPKITTVWETKDDDVLAADKDKFPSGDVIICPECGEKAPVTDGILLLACTWCGHLFQAGLDQAASRSSVQPVKKSPLARAVRDTSSMRLFLLSRPEVMPETVGEQGGILGENGTVLKQLRTGQQISLRHTPAGWYAMTIKGHLLYNGVPQNAGRQLRLSDGDMIIMDKEQIQVEII